MGSDDYECPEYGCRLTFETRDEVLAHLRWDHNRSAHRAEMILSEDDDDD